MEPASSTRHVCDQRSSGVADPAEQGVGLIGIGEALRQGGDGEGAAGTGEEGTVVGDAGLPAGLAGEGDPGREVACQAVAVLLLGESRILQAQVSGWDASTEDLTTAHDMDIHPGARMNVYNPCLPYPDSRTCPVSVPFSGAWAPFNRSENNDKFFVFN